MKIAIFGYPRSGTTMLNYIIHQHLIAASVVEKWAAISEVFNPLEGTRLLVSHPAGHLINYTNLKLPEVQPREERLQLFKEHAGDDYIIKLMPFDTTEQGVVKAVMDAGYNIIAVERRNPLSAFLSSIIAYHHEAWHIYDADDQPVYEPFVASSEEMNGLGISMSRYYRYRDHLKPSVILYYEDMATQSASTTLKQAGVYQEGVVTEESPTKKMLSFEDKTKLVINLEEVIDHLNGILLPYDITMEHNNL